MKLRKMDVQTEVDLISKSIEQMEDAAWEDLAGIEACVATAFVYKMTKEGVLEGDEAIRFIRDNFSTMLIGWIGSYFLDIERRTKLVTAKIEEMRMRMEDGDVEGEMEDA